jgi:Fe-S-cluster containining protein
MDDTYQDFPLAKLNYHPIRILDSSGQIQEYFIGLKFWEIPQGQATCFFYNAYENRCRVHAHKPMVCRLYPHAFFQNGISLHYYGKCHTAPQLNFIETKTKIELLQQASREREEFRNEILHWDSIIMDVDKTVGNMIRFIFPRYPAPDPSHEFTTAERNPSNGLIENLFRNQN